MMPLQVFPPASLFLLITLSVVESQQNSQIFFYKHRSVCALKKSSVSLDCSYLRQRFSRVFWSKQLALMNQPPDLSEEPEYTGRVQYLQKTSYDCTLILSNVAERDSRKYYVTGVTTQGQVIQGRVGVDLSVTDLEVDMSPSMVMEGNFVTLTCRTSCFLTNPPTFTWYKNDHELDSSSEKLDLQSVSQEDAGKYSCSVKGERFRSRHIDLIVHYAPKNVAVSIKSSGELLEGTSVSLTCSSDASPPVKVYTWNKGRNVKKAAKTYTITQISSEDSGEYTCKAVNEFGFESAVVSLNVLYPPKSVSVSIRPSGEIVEGSSLTLTCSSDANPPAHEYTWYKGGSLKGKGKTYKIRKISSDDRGGYKCTAGNRFGEKESDDATVTVRYAPKSVSVSVSPSGEKIDGAAVTLTCSSDAHPPVTYTWFKSGTLMGKGKTYSIKQMNSEDGGEYTCKSSNQYGEKVSDGVPLNFIDPSKRPSVSISPSGEIVEGATVTLSCSGDDNSPLSDYTWYKGTSIIGRGSTYIVRKIQPQDRGQYKCKFSDKYGERYSDDVTVSVLYAPQKTTVSIRPSGEIVEGSAVTLTCSSDANPPAHEYAWYNGRKVIGTGKTYNIKKTSSEERRSYKCKAGNQYGEKESDEAALNLQYAPRIVSVSIRPSGEIVEGSSLTLTCSSDANPPAHEYTWYKGGSLIGKGETYNIRKISSDDRGGYKCTAGNRFGEKGSDDATVTVRYAPKSVSVSVSPSGEKIDGAAVTLTCSSDAHPPVTYTWFKSGTLMGKGKTYSIKQMNSENGGEYTCKSSNQYGEKVSDGVPLNFIDPSKRPSVSISPSGEIVEGATVILSCSGDDNSPLSDYTWYKGTSIIGRGSTYIVRKIQPQDRGQYKCKFSDKYGERYSDDVTVSVLYAPQKTTVSIRPSGEIVEGSAVTLTCSSDANPPVNYTWFKGGAFVRTARSYTFNRINPEDSGEYKCKSSNRFGDKYAKVDLKVFYPPRNVSVSISSPGETVTLTCSADANPPVHNYTWFEDNERSAVGPNYSVAMNISSGAWFSCEARNKYGSQRAPPVSLMLNATSSSDNSVYSFLIIVTVGVGVGLCVMAAFIVGLFCIRRKRQKRNTDQHQGGVTHTENTSYSSLEPMAVCSNNVYDTLATPRPEPPDDTYAALDPRTISPDYDTLTAVRKHY